MMYRREEVLNAFHVHGLDWSCSRHIFEKSAFL